MPSRWIDIISYGRTILFQRSNNIPLYLCTNLSFICLRKWTTSQLLSTMLEWLWDFKQLLEILLWSHWVDKKWRNWITFHFSFVLFVEHPAHGVLHCDCATVLSHQGTLEFWFLHLNPNVCWSFLLWFLTMIASTHMKPFVFFWCWVKRSIFVHYVVTCTLFVGKKVRPSSLTIV